MTSTLPTSDTPVHLAIALDGTGWHPASWRRTGSRATEVFTGRYWTDQALTAERGLIDFITIEDSLALHAGTPFGPAPVPTTSRLVGRLDASLVASWVATRTERIGIVPTITTTHTEPFHVSKNLATLDHVSLGRAGWRVQVSARPAEAAHVGRRAAPFGDVRDARDLASPEAQAQLRSLFDEAGDVIEVVRRLWDSWEDGAEIRDAATGRFIDRDKLHYIDFEGEYFSVKGPSITPRPPQGQPVVTALGHQPIPYELAARGADVLYVTPRDDEDAAAILAQVRELEGQHRTADTPLKVFADLEVVLSTPEHGDGAARLRQLDEVAGEEFTSDALVFAGDAAALADLVQRWHALGYAGFRLRPAEHAIDLPAITDALVPALQRAGLFRTAYGPSTLRERLGLPAAVNRYAASA
ncbi:LLM class flavin-dependent oxidoreductase [Ornithinicoccus hortensis]|uniref:Alkanesulfonate monooxygenase SsuD/methylene tetrahydromethanopterin reductase-like flavin-dependent oxidoreductase (Luciferase family) n=1 Tax=Ornithinicoccus hortensis TaxID=82346 RepID=A0A542YMI1_9MICO|nr:LLM class flavin-dependent oxidoreductase [Ornithinicoccus hortensis]TQL49297.1 alkanesulfonate monooxygenase SsuD/methylene tetrahydromethanopterin reductase-like flavin-dependent oxidoreductase (luciferase family) [Ornithinicoccus hortensis]